MAMKIPLSLVAFLCLLPALTAYSLDNRASSSILASTTKSDRGPISSYIGLEYIDLPSELRNFGGSVIGSSLEEPIYTVSWIVDARCEFQPCPVGTRSMLWLEKILDYDRSGKPYRQVLDLADLPDLPGDFSEQLFFSCRRNGEPDPEILAIAKYDPDQEFLTEILHAWRANRDAGKIESISTEGIRCENPGWGV
jgi:hypothetical protein